MILEEVIRRHVPLSTPSAKGWQSTRCLVCNDHTRKGLRGGFRFAEGATSYNCFNCKHKATYNPEYNTRMPSKMLRVMRAFGIPDEEWQQIVFEALANEGTKPKRVEPDRSLITPEIALPAHFYQIGSRKDDKWSIAASEYLRDLRGIDPNEYPFYLSDHKDWKGRITIPVYRDGKLIFYQGRDITDKRPNKYKSSHHSNSSVLFGFKELYDNTDLPLYVVEGFFDAYVIEGVATLGNKLTPEQIKHLHRSPRSKVIIPDRRGDGHVMAEQALEEGWSISCPDIGDCKDVNQAWMRYGNLYVMKTIADMTMIGVMAETALRMYCERNEKNKRTGKKKG